MKKYFLATAIIFLLGFKAPFQISGKYKIVYDTKYFPNGEGNCTVEFRANQYTKYVDKNETIVGGIKRISNKNATTTIQLRDFTFNNPKEEVNKVKQKENAIIEFQESDLDTIVFRTTYSKNVKKTINTGKLIKIKVN